MKLLQLTIHNFQFTTNSQASINSCKLLIESFLKAERFKLKADSEGGVW